MEYDRTDYQRLYNATERRGRAPADPRLIAFVNSLAEPAKPRMLTLREYVLLAAIAVLLGFLTGCDDGQAATVLGKIERDAAQRKELRPDQLTHPLPCDLTLREMVGGVLMRPEQCYRRRVKP
jgi:hypothetical protein